MRRFLPGVVSILLATPAVAIIASDTVQLTDANGTILMDLTGNPATGSILEADEATNGFGMLTFTMSGTIPSTLQAALTEPAAVSISDTVMITQVPDSQGIVVSVGSDAELPGLDCGNVGFTACTPETGQLQDLTSLLFPNGGAPFHVKIQSDTEVPEPSTAVLLAAGISGMSFVWRRRLCRAT